MTRAADLAKLIAGGGTITVADNSDTLTLESTDADANVGPVLNLHRNSASPADGDLTGRIVFKADDDAGNAATFARIEATAVDVSNGGEDGRLDFFTAKDDAFTAALSILGTDVGIGTTSPSALLHLKSAGPNIKLEDSDNDSDFEIKNGNGTLRIIDNTNSTDRVNIDSSGNVLIGTTSSTFGNEGVRIKPAGSSGALQAQFMNDSGGIAVSIGRGGSDGMCLQFTRGSQERGGVSVNGSSTTYATSSDYRLKENVVTDWDATTRLKQLKPSRFNFKENKDTTLDGFLAHEVTSIVPEATTGTKDEVDKDGNPIYQGIDPSKLVPLLTKAVQEAIAKIEALEAKVATLESK